MIARAFQAGAVIAQIYHVDRVVALHERSILVQARHLRTGELLAIKAFDPPGRDGADRVARFISDCEAAILLESQHAVRVLSAGKLANGAPYVVTEWLDAPSLWEVLRTPELVPVKTAIDWVMQAGDALWTAHRMGLAHGAVGLGKLHLLGAGTNENCVKVRDFGVAKYVFGSFAVSVAESEIDQIDPNSIRFCAPEVIGGHKIDARSDVWSLGCVIYQLLTGCPAFPGDEIDKLLSGVSYARCELGAIGGVDVPEHVRDIIAKCLQKHPSKRFQSVGQLLDTLEPFGDPQSVGVTDRAARKANNAGSSDEVAFDSAGAISAVPELTQAGPVQATMASVDHGDGNLSAPAIPDQVQIVSIRGQATFGHDSPNYDASKVSVQTGSWPCSAIEPPLSDPNESAQSGSRPARLPLGAHRRWTLAILIFACGAVVACAVALWLGIHRAHITAAVSPSASARSDFPIRVEGSRVFIETIMRTWVTRFLARNPGPPVILAATTSTEGLTALLDGRIDLAVSTSVAPPELCKRAADNGINLRWPESEHLVGVSGVAIVVSPHNPVNELTLEQVRAIFTGKLTDWSSLGGSHVPIRVLMRPKGLGMRDVFSRTVLFQDDHLLAGTESILLNSELESRLIDDATAISFATFAEVGRNKAVRIATRAGSHPIAPSSTTIANRLYPLSTGMYVYSRGVPQGRARDLVNYMTTEGRAMIGEFGYVGYAVELIGDPQGVPGVATLFGRPDAKRRRFNTALHFLPQLRTLTDLAFADLSQIAATICPMGGQPVEIVAMLGEHEIDLSAAGHERAGLVAKELEQRCPELDVKPMPEVQDAGAFSPGDKSKTRDQWHFGTVMIWLREL